MTWSAHITVATIVERSGQFLMVREDCNMGYPVLNQPAGHLEANESLIAAALRETLEETTWNVQINALVGIYKHTPPQRSDLTFVRFCFAATALHQEPNRKLDTGIIEALWMTAEDIRLHPQLRSPMVWRCLSDFLNGQRYPVDSIVEI